MTLFDWLNEITIKKTPADNFSEESWDSFNSYMVSRYLSMDINYIELVNYVQKISPQNKKQIYTSRHFFIALSISSLFSLGQSPFL